MSYKVYGPSGEYQGEIKHNDGAGEGFVILFFLGTVCLMIYVGVSSLWNYLEHWHAYSAPYNYIAAFYYFVVHGFISLFTFPYKLGVDFFDYLKWFDLTPYKNINLITSWFLKLSYIVITAVLVWQALKVVYRLLTFGVTKVILFFPAILGVLSFCFMWLFER